MEEAALRDWFEKTLITPMETRSTAYRGDKTTGGIPNNAVDILEGRHLIRAEYRAGVRWYELTHDRFIEAIVASNKEWHARKRTAFRNPLTEPARNWNRLDRDDASLLRGALLEEANEWFQSNPAKVDNLERAFLKASQANELREKFSARTAQTLRVLTFGLALALIIAAAASVTALWQRDEALKALSQFDQAAKDARKAEADQYSALHSASTGTG
ncbi:MAG TPA: hypothetical protein VFR47_14020 [Anaerolineales bacterium]|nr:hypothetical protein [Anaerolineales bacterium]